MKKQTIILLSLALFTLNACSSGVGTNDGDNGDGSGLGTKTTKESFQVAQIQKNVFSVGADYPADLEIPDQDNLSSTVFIAGDGEALGVIPIDLETKQFSTKFSGLDAGKAGVDSVLLWARKVHVISSTQALMLGGAGLVYFNPVTGQVYDSVDLNAPINLQSPLELSYPFDWDNNGVDDTEISGSFEPSAADSLAVVGDKVFVSMSNYFTGNGDPLLYVQSILLVFELNNQSIEAANTPYVALEGFNATAITPDFGKLIVTLSGSTQVQNGQGIPLSDSKLIKVNPQDLQIEEELNLGKVGANYQELAITEDGRAFLGSYAYSEMYVIDLNEWDVLRGETNPILLSDEADDYINDQKIAAGGDILFVSSQNRNTVQAISLADEIPEVLNHTLNFGFNENPGITGAGPMAVRPGLPNVDYVGADLWLLTSFPGTLSSAITY